MPPSKHKKSTSNGAARLLLLSPDGMKALLAFEQRGKNQALNMLGGKCRPGEHPALAAAREAHEETKQCLSQSTRMAVSNGQHEYTGYCTQTSSHIFVYRTTDSIDLTLGNSGRGEGATGEDGKSKILSLHWLPVSSVRNRSWRQKYLYDFANLDFEIGLKRWLSAGVADQAPPAFTHRHTLTTSVPSSKRSLYSLVDERSSTSLASKSSDATEATENVTSAGSRNTNSDKKRRLIPPCFQLAATAEEVNYPNEPICPTPLNKMFVEEYDGRRLSEALRCLACNQAARLAVIDEYKKLLEVKRTSGCNADEIQQLEDFLHRVRRTEDAYRFMQALDVYATRSHGTSTRTLLVGYARNSLKNANAMISLYGRRYCKSAGGKTISRLDKPWELPRTLGQQGAPREVRALLCGEMHLDVDIENAFNVIALALGKVHGLDEASLPYLSEYTRSTERRESILREIQERHGFTSREAAKRLPLTLLHGGTYYGWKKNVNPPRPGPEVEFVQGFAKDVIRCARRILAAQTPIEASIVSDKDAYLAIGKSDAMKPNGALTDCERSMFAHILQTYEDRILCMIVTSLQTQGWDVSSLIYDGCLVRISSKETKKDASKRIEDSLRKAEKHVFEQTHGRFRIGLKCKEMMDARPIIAEWKTVHLERI